MSDSRVIRAGEIIILLLILMLAAYLRMSGLKDMPGVYSDEGTILNITHNLLQGRWSYMAINESTLIAARMPLYPILLAGLSLVIGEGLATLRLLSTGLSVLSVLLVYWAVREFNLPSGRIIALLAALILAIYPSSILYSRLGFSYNLLAPLFLVVFILAWWYLDSKRASWLYIAGFIIGLGILSDLVMLVLVLPLALIASTRGWRIVRNTLGTVGISLGMYSLCMLVIAKSAFIFDLRYILTRMGTIPLLAQMPVVALNYSRLLTRDPWLIPAVIGLFLVNPIRKRWLALLFFILPLLLIGRSTTDLDGLGFHYLIPLLPMVALGISALIGRAFPAMKGTFESGLSSLFNSWKPGSGTTKTTWLERRMIALVSSISIFMLLAAPFVISALTIAMGSRAGFNTPIDNVLIDVHEASAAASFINSRTARHDLVLASPAIAWMIHSQVADFQQTLAFEGTDTLHVPADLPRQRFSYDASSDRARFAVIDNIWRNWAAQAVPNADKLLVNIQKWDLAFETDSIQVYENPSH